MIAVDLGEAAELLHDPDDAAVGGGCDAVVAHVAQLLLDDGLWCGVGGQDRSDMPGGPGRQGGGRCQGHQHRQQCGLVDQQRDLRPPGQCGGVPLAQHGGGLLAVLEGWWADAVE